VASTKEVVTYLRFNLRSQIYAKSLPMAMTIGAIKRLEIIQTHPEYKQKLWTIVTALQKGLKEAGLDLGKTESPVTPVFFKCPLAQVTQLIYDLRENYGIFCSVVIYPVVPKDVVMLRLIPTAAHSLKDVEYTIKAFAEIKRKVDNNEYPHEMADFSK
jgi:glycine C-acetyltransferase